MTTAPSVTTSATPDVPGRPDGPHTLEAITIPPHSAAPQDADSPGPTSPVGTPEDAHALTEKSIDDMRAEIDGIDAELVRLIQRRSEISHAIGAARAAEGGTRIVYSREMKVLDRFAVLGPAGTELGMLLLSLGRGKLGRR